MRVSKCSAENLCVTEQKLRLVNISHTCNVCLTYAALVLQKKKKVLSSRAHASETLFPGRDIKRYLQVWPS